MKKALLTLSVMAAALSVMAQGGAKPQKKLTCPVMKGNPVNVERATKEKLFADYKGRRYYFCCGMCPGPFKKDPAKYANKANSLPIPTTKKK